MTLNNGNHHESVYTIGTSPDGKKITFTRMNMVASDSIMPQISDVFQGKGMSEEVAKFMKGINSSKAILSTAGSEELEMTSKLTAYTRGGIMDIPYSVSVQTFVDAFNGKANSCIDNTQYMQTFYSILEKTGIIYNPASTVVEITNLA